MRFRGLCLLLTSIFLFAGCNGSSSDSDNSNNGSVVTTPESPVIIAHRGASGYLPEHTLAAYELAIQMGTDYIEPDLQFTSDGFLVAMHDETLDGTTDVKEVYPGRSSYNVSDFTLAEVKTLTVKPRGATAQTSYPGYTPSILDPFKVPTFDEVINFAKEQSVVSGRVVGIYPEAKQADPKMEDLILKTLIDHNYKSAKDKVYIQSFSQISIANLKAKQNEKNTKIPMIILGVAMMVDGKAHIGIINGASIQPLTVAAAAEIAEGLGILIEYPAYPITQEFISQAHAEGLKIHGWTFGKSDPTIAAAEYKKYLDMGMDGLFSNYPDLAVEAVRLFADN